MTLTRRRPAPARALALAFVAILAASAAFPLGAAGVSIPELSLLTHGSVNDSLFTLNSRIFLDMAVEGGSKFLASLKLGIASNDLEGDYSLMDAANLALIFKSASITMRGDEKSHFEGTWFIGALDTLCSGAEFPSLYGTPRIATNLRGYMYSPNGIGADPNASWDGIHAIKGTGLKLTLKSKYVRSSLYTYQDLIVGPGNYAADLRLMVNTRNFKMDSFLGGTYDVENSIYGYYRAGALFWIKAGEVGSFLVEAGLPRFDPGFLPDFGMKQFFFLLEVRLKVGVFSFIPTLFYHPAWYLMKETDEGGTLDLNFNLKFGDLETGGKLQGGMETMLTFNPDAATSPLLIKASPYISTSLGGAIWDAKLSMSVFPVNADNFLEMMEIYIGAKTGF